MMLELLSILGQLQGVDAGEAVDALRQNNAVVGILYVIVLAQSAVIIKLWLKIDKIQEARVQDMKDRLDAEDSLKRDFEKEVQNLKELIRNK